MLNHPFISVIILAIIVGIILLKNSIKTHYSLLEKSPYDVDTPKTYWIKRETIFGFKLIGKYRFDDTYGELGDCPFFDKEEAKLKLKEYEKL